MGTNDAARKTVTVDTTKMGICVSLGDAAFQPDAAFVRTKLTGKVMGIVKRAKLAGSGVAQCVSGNASVRAVGTRTSIAMSKRPMVYVTVIALMVFLLAAHVVQHRAQCATMSHIATLELRQWTTIAHILLEVAQVILTAQTMIHRC